MPHRVWFERTHNSEEIDELPYWCEQNCLGRWGYWPRMLEEIICDFELGDCRLTIAEREIMEINRDITGYSIEYPQTYKRKDGTIKGVRLREALDFELEEDALAFKLRFY